MEGRPLQVLANRACSGIARTTALVLRFALNSLMQTRCMLPHRKMHLLLMTRSSGERGVTRTSDNCLAQKAPRPRLMECGSLYHLHAFP